jgi:transcriptional regulator with XRE-family HTH domain
MSKTFFEKFLSDKRHQRVYHEEGLITEVAELIYKLMQSENIKNKELAEKLKVSDSQISQWLDGSANMQLRTVADIFFELGCRVKIQAEDLNKRSCLTEFQNTEKSGWTQRRLNRPVSTKPAVPNYKVAI